MPDTPTPRLGLPRPSGGDDDFPPQDFAALAARLELIAAADDQGPYSAIGSATGKRGFYYYATDATGPGLFRSNGTAWVLVAASVAAVDSVPAVLYDGQRFAYRPDPTNQPSVRWEFVRANGQWLFVSGSPLWFFSESVATWTFTSFAGFKETSFSLPLAGDYWVTASCRMECNGRALVIARPTNEVFSDTRRIVDGPAGVGTRTFRETNVTAGRVYGFGQRLVTGTEMASANHSLSALPIRVTA